MQIYKMVQAIPNKKLGGVKGDLFKKTYQLGILACVSKPNKYPISNKIKIQDINKKIDF